MATTIKKTMAKDQKDARQSVEVLKRITGGAKPQDAVVFQVEGTSISVPRKAVLLLEKVLDEMADGRSVEIASYSKELSTQEAADLLKVSRPHLVKLLETGKIPYKKVGPRRRVLLEDVKKYDSLLRETRNSALDKLVREAQEMGLGY
ncbi:helix-turn-helix domain-containing protein [Aquiflexum lacus]|uniref:helix-turn-helix domain-containing protein n=1 Tax=Aquiflexum lacus TaxID=2483805 RepID=UPI00189421A7|nr:helix-turn-helix domain-containing protein [Aquiflexum lacus]